MQANKFAKHQRLLKRSEFTETMNSGIKIVGPLFILFGRERKSQDFGRLGLIVTKKNGHAVTRNLIKRHLREAYRRNVSTTSLSNYDIVLIARYRAVKAKQFEVDDAIVECARRLERKIKHSKKPVAKECM